MKILEQYLHPDIENYSATHTSPEDSIMQAINRKTHLQQLRPRMLSGAYQGKLLEMLSHMIRPKKILEVGTYVGYSAICLTKGLTENGMLHTIEVDEELEECILENFRQANVQDKIRLHIGNAMDIIPTLPESFDLSFIDADKINYLNYYELILEKTRPGGFILADNILWNGKVLYEQPSGDKESAVLKAFNDRIQNDDRVENILLPIRDGLMLARKVE